MPLYYEEKKNELNARLEMLVKQRDKEQLRLASVLQRHDTFMEELHTQFRICGLFSGIFASDFAQFSILSFKNIDEKERGEAQWKKKPHPGLHFLFSHIEDTGLWCLAVKADDRLVCLQAIDKKSKLGHQLYGASLIAQSWNEQKVWMANLIVCSAKDSEFFPLEISQLISEKLASNFPLIYLENFFQHIDSAFPELVNVLLKGQASFLEERKSFGWIDESGKIHALTPALRQMLGQKFLTTCHELLKTEENELKSFFDSQGQPTWQQLFICLNDSQQRYQEMFERFHEQSTKIGELKENERHFSEKLFGGLFKEKAQLSQQASNDIAMLCQSQNYYAMLEQFEKCPPAQYQQLANVKSQDGYPLLHIACMTGHVPMVRVLLSYGADPLANDHYGYKAFHYVAKGKNVLEALDDPNAGLLDETNCEQNMRLLINAMLSRYANDPQKEKKMLEVINVVGMNERTPLEEAVFNNRVLMAKYLIKQGANVNMIDSDKMTLLHKAVWQNKNRSHFVMIDLLLENGANVQLQNGMGKNVLEFAHEFKQFELLDFLREHNQLFSEEESFKHYNDFMRLPELTDDHYRELLFWYDNLVHYHTQRLKQRCDEWLQEGYTKLIERREKAKRLRFYWFDHETEQLKNKVADRTWGNFQVGSMGEIAHERQLLKESKIVELEVETKAMQAQLQSEIRKIYLEDLLAYKQTLKSGFDEGRAKIVDTTDSKASIAVEKPVPDNTLARLGSPDPWKRQKQVDQLLNQQDKQSLPYETMIQAMCQNLLCPSMVKILRAYNALKQIAADVPLPYGVIIEALMTHIERSPLSRRVIFNCLLELPPEANGLLPYETIIDAMFDSLENADDAEQKHALDCLINLDERLPIVEFAKIKSRIEPYLTADQPVDLRQESEDAVESQVELEVGHEAIQDDISLGAVAPMFDKILSSGQVSIEQIDDEVTLLFTSKNVTDDFIQKFNTQYDAGLLVDVRGTGMEEAYAVQLSPQQWEQLQVQVKSTRSSSYSDAELVGEHRGWMQPALTSAEREAIEVNELAQARAQSLASLPLIEQAQRLNEEAISQEHLEVGLAQSEQTAVAESNEIRFPNVPADELPSVVEEEDTEHEQVAPAAAMMEPS